MRHPRDENIMFYHSSIRRNHSNGVTTRFAIYSSTWPCVSLLGIVQYLNKISNTANRLPRTTTTDPCLSSSSITDIGPYMRQVSRAEFGISIKYEFKLVAFIDPNAYFFSIGFHGIDSH